MPVILKLLLCLLGVLCLVALIAAMGPRRQAWDECGETFEGSRTDD